MTLRERATLATKARQRRASERAGEMRAMVDQGACLKRAAHEVGVSYRTAKRYRKAA